MEVTLDIPSPLSYDLLIELSEQTPLRAWITSVLPLVEARLTAQQHGLFADWCSVLQALPASDCPITVQNGVITLETKDHFGYTVEELTTLLKKLSPWRKGPWQIGEVFIDTEWRSDWKWDRLKPHISDLKGRMVLDVGCGSGYHAYRVALEGAKLVVGIDPGQLSVVQSQLFQHLGEPLPVWVLPLGIEDVSPQLHLFDTLFCMGVLYHRKSPIDHLFELRGMLKKGGELVLETLIVDEAFGDLLFPEERYAKMRNVWFIPSVTLLSQWLERVGFAEIRCVNVEDTTVEEQRPTEWMTGESLPHFLDPANPKLTIEGYPAPRRAIVIATKI